MANATANVQLNVTGNAQQQLQKLQKSVKGVQDSFSGLRNALGGIAIGSFLVNLAKAADEMNDLSKATGVGISTIMGLGDALKVSGGDAEDTATLITKLSQAIDDGREGSLKAEYQFNRLGISLEELRNLSDEDVLRKTIQGLAKMPAGAERTALAMELLGKKARSIDWNNLNGSLDQFIGKAKNAEQGTVALAGVYENFKNITTSFTRQLTVNGTGIAELLQKLTSNTEQIAKAMADLTKVIVIAAGAFALLRIPKIINEFYGFALTLQNSTTLSKTLTLAVNNLRAALGQLFTVIGLGNLASKNYAGGLKSLIDIFLNLGRAGARLGGIGLVVVAIGEAFKFLTGTVNPVIEIFKVLRDLLVVSTAGFVLAFKELYKVIEPVVNIIKTGFIGAVNILRNTFGPAIDFISEKLSKLGKFWKETVRDAEEVLGIANKAAKSTGGPLVIQGQGAQAIPKDYFKGSSQSEFDRLKKGIEDTTKAFIDQKNAQAALLNVQASYNLMSDRAKAIVEAQRGIYDDFNTQIEQYKTKISQLTPEQKKLEPVYRAQIATLIQLRDVQMEQATSAISLTYDQIDAQQDLLAATQRTFEAYRAENALADLEAELDLMGLQGDELERQSKFLRTQQEMRDSVLSTVEQLILLEQKYGNNKDANYQREKSQLESQLEIARKTAEGKLKIDEEYYKRKEELENSYQEGVKNALKDISKQFKPINMAQEAIQKGWSAISNAVDTFVQTGKFKFSDFARSVIADLAKMIIKAQIFKAISGIAGAFGISLPGLAEGGPAKAGQPYIVGEKGPELFVPKQSGTVVPNNQLGNNGAGTAPQAAGPITNNYNTYNINALDARSVAQLFAENRKAIFGANKMAEREMSYSGVR
jgi:lambda family phage tail tape measure protein